MAKGWRALVLVVLVAFAVELAQTGSGHALLQKAGLLKAPASYTTLSFEHPQLLPRQLTAKKSSVNISFLIHNATGSPHTYNWQVHVVHGKGSTPVASGWALVSAGASAKVSRAIRTSCVSGKVDFVIKLAAQQESINFWSACWHGSENSS